MNINQSILNDVRAEKLCSTPDKHHIQRCQKILDNIKNLSHEKFIGTGHIMSKAHILDRYPHRKLQEDTKTVCRYLGGFCIEFVGEDDFFWNYHKDKDFKHVEMTLFNHLKTLIDEQ